MTSVSQLWEPGHRTAILIFDLLMPKQDLNSAFQPGHNSFQGEKPHETAFRPSCDTKTHN